MPELGLLPEQGSLPQLEHELGQGQERELKLVVQLELGLLGPSGGVLLELRLQPLRPLMLGATTVVLAELTAAEPAGLAHGLLLLAAQLHLLQLMELLLLRVLPLLQLERQGWARQGYSGRSWCCRNGVRGSRAAARAGPTIQAGSDGAGPATAGAARAAGAATRDAAGAAARARVASAFYVSEVSSGMLLSVPVGL